MKLSIFLVGIALVNFLIQQDSMAQNPLRFRSDKNLRFVSNENEIISPVGVENTRLIPNSPEHQQVFAKDNQVAKQHPPEFDRNVEAAAFTEIPKFQLGNEINSSNLNGHVDEMAMPNLISSRTNVLSPSKNKMLELVMKISLNLAFVLSIAVGIILISRKWLSNNKSNSSERAVGDSLVVRETLRIDSRTLLRLVQWRSNRFLVASDQNGIQSVKTLNLSFDQTLQELDDNNANEEKLLKQLLAGLNQK